MQRPPNGAIVPGRAHGTKRRLQAGFTLLELVVAMTLFAFIVIEVLADREKSIHMSADARNIQTTRYLAASKVDEIRHDPEQFGESDSGDFEELQTDWQDFSGYTWEIELKRVVAVGGTDERGEEFLFSEDEDETPVQDSEGNDVEPLYVRRLTLTVRFEPDGELRPELSVKIVTYLPPAEEEEDGG